MPVKDHLDVVMTPEARADLARVHELARGQGVDLRYRRRADSNMVLSDSAAFRWALRLVASGQTRASAGSDPPKPRDSDRLRAAMLRLGLDWRGVAAAAGVSGGHVRAVLSGSVPMSAKGALFAWVVERERT